MTSTPRLLNSWRDYPLSHKKKLRDELRRTLAAKEGSSSPLLGSDLPWRVWVTRNFPVVCTAPFAPRQEGLWQWFALLSPGVKPAARVEVWPRGGAKSSTGEMGTTYVGARLTRRFVLYLSETQPQADKHVQSIATLFESMGVSRDVNRYGASKGWARDQLRTANGFNVAAMGLDAAGRGAKLDSYRPDLIILDDIDGRHDTEQTVQKKIETLTQSLLPSGSSDCAVLVLQNKIHKNSIVSRLVDGRADFLHGREVATVEPAVISLQTIWREQPSGRMGYTITEGVPTWAGQDIATCEAQINEWGLGAFLREAQHDVDEEEGGLWKREQFNNTRVESYPTLTTIVVALDPNTTSNNDEAGIVVAGAGMLNGVRHAFVLEDATVAGGPQVWAQQAVAKYNLWKADRIVAEQNNGGDMIALTIKTVSGAPPVKLVHASRGKITRAEPVQKLYADGIAHNVGHLPMLETECCTYKADSRMPSPGRMDALVWALTELMLNTPIITKVRAA